ncbi:MAG: hypothetical protein WCZ28_15390 [Burkholderiaceae bacterium]
MSPRGDVHSGFRGSETDADRRHWGGRPRHLLHAPVIWALHFGFVYGASALFCAGRGTDIETTRILVLVASVLALALLVATCIPAWRLRRRLGAETPTSSRRERRFLAAITLSTCALAGFAIILGTLPALISTSCS